MKHALSLIAILFLLFSAFLMTGMVYIVKETEQVVLTQFGQPIGKPITSAGLHFKTPFMQEAHYFDKRLLDWDGVPNQIPTGDKKYIWVDTMARWYIVDALKFLQAMGNERGAQARLDDIINSATRDVITSNILVEVVRNSNRVLDEKENPDKIMFAEEALEKIQLGREALENEILIHAKKIAPQYGIDIMDVRIKRINYVQEVRKKVYERMIAERKRAAEEYRSEGMGKRATIKGKMGKELKSITSKAFRESQIIKGKADQTATKIYASAYSQDAQFFYFIKTMEGYATSICSGTTAMLSTDSDYLKFFNKIE
ncbi:protease FtsH subunit HflC [Candidatus Omnitrophus magneticus]|uniref:Protein HflC n=1 Tax=Candidatus Omnitrophus magneticus TaxID=1609969 RepID=A0A0F0CS38_9BACT|nr:protease FtsH subunit HflC [Candidatus Omnitrophus magneticus]